MKRRAMLDQKRSLTLSIVLIWLLVSGSVVGRPNIVLIIGDDQAWSDYGFMGHPVIKTPNLDRLASEGLVYRFGYVPSSLCRPSLATIITGLYPHQHGITGNDPAHSGEINRNSPEYLQRNESLINRMERSHTLPRLLDGVGYLSFQAGKWWEGHYSRGGFTHGMTHGDPTRGGRHGDEGLSIGRNGLQPLFDFIQAAGDTPFFIWYAPFLPHTPHAPPQRLLSEYRSEGRSLELSRYYAMCEWFDETVGQLLERLDSAGLARNTLVLFVADNGWVQRSEDTPVPSGWDFAFAPGSKRSAHENGIRTPLILRWLGKIKPAQSDIPVSSIDLAPTILRAAGVEPTQSMPGVDLLDNSAVAGRETIFGDIYTHDIVDPLNPVASLKYRWCVRRPWKLIVPHSPNIVDAELQLYDVVDDPDESKNLLSKNPDLVMALYRQIQDWWKVD